jgi:hypothetical protein
MNKKIYISMIAGLMLFLPACDLDNLTDLDNPKYQLVPENTDMSMMFSNIIVSAGRRAEGGNTIQLGAGYVKYYATFSFILETSNLLQFNQDRNDNQWAAYNNELKMAVALEDYLVKQNDPKQVNNLARTRIIKALIIQRLTDFYGDIPIFDAGKAYTENLIKPGYDKQQDIYKYLLETVDQAVGSLSNDAALNTFNWKGPRDLIYNGNIDKWRRFGNSLLLRIAMRISEVDPNMAKTYAEKAIAGGVISANADNWILPTRNAMNSEKNAYSMYFEGSPSGDPERYIKLSEYFVDFLKAKEDPRRKVIFGGRLKPEVEGFTASNMQSYWRDPGKWNWEIDAAKGMMHGTPANPSASLGAYHKTYTSPNPFLWTLDRGHEGITAGEMHYLKADASLKNWNTGTTAQTAYEEGIKASMSKYSGYAGLLEFQKINQDEINAYISANPLGTGAAARQRLAEELWVHLYMDPAESWFHVRRVNLDMPPNVAGKPMPRRNAYVNNERLNNYDNLVKALTWLGLGESATVEQEWYNRVWWDK